MSADNKDWNSDNKVRNFNIKDANVIGEVPLML